MTTPPNPPASPAPAKPKKPLWRRLLKWTIRTFIVLFVLGLATYAITYYWAAKTINAEVARIRAAGEPLTFTDLNKLTPKVDRAQDAGPYYTAAAELINVDYETDEANYDIFFGRKPLLSPVPADALAWAHRGIDQNRVPLDLIDRGAALPGCNSDIQLQFGIAVALPRLGRIRALCNASSLRTRVLAAESHGDQAVDSLISSLGLLRMLDRQPMMIDALVQVALLSRTCQDASYVMEPGHPSDAALQKLEDALRRLHLIEPRRMFIAERVYTLEIMRNFIASAPADNPADFTTPVLPERQMFSPLGITGRVMVARSLPTSARFITAATGDFPNVFASMQAVVDTPTSLWDQIINPSIGKAMVLYALSLSNYRSTLIALQIERYRRAHAGQLPPSLADLPNPKDLSLDPFTGTPLLYVKTPDGYCIMSAGRGNPEDDSRHIDRDKDPIAWSQRWGTHIRTTLP